MRRTAVLLGLAMLLAIPALAHPDSQPGESRRCHSLGDGGSTYVNLDRTYNNPRWSYLENHDGVFETAYCWSFLLWAPPYEGAFAEGFVGPARVEAMRIYVTSEAGIYLPVCVDLYIWDNDIAGPGGVLALQPDLISHLPVWPEIEAVEFSMPRTIVGDHFYVGLWDSMIGGSCPYAWYIAADCDEWRGDCWTYVPGNSGYPEGWQPIDIVWEVTRSLGIGVYVSDFSAVPDDSGWRPPVEAHSWGRIKTLFQ